jgi:hypothetical protein
VDLNRNVSIELAENNKKFYLIENDMKVLLHESFTNITAIAVAAEQTSKNSEILVRTMLQSTYENVTEMVTEAQNSLYAQEKNISARMTAMGRQLDQSILDLHQSVDKAKADISSEVQEVHDSMNQYISFTNNKFAAENAFVKYQLAGIQTRYNFT